MDASVARRYDAIAPGYDAARRRGWWEIYDEITWRHATEGLAPRSRVLDAGAGSGRFAERFLAAGHEVTLLDPSPGMLAEARERLSRAGRLARAAFVLGGIEQIPLPGARFDLVFCEGDPLSYARDARHDAARELVRVLAPGGRLYVSCDNRWLSALALLGAGRLDAGTGAARTGASVDPYGIPVHAFGPSELRELLERAGAVDVEVTGKIGLLHLLAPATVERLLGDETSRARMLEIEARFARDPTLCGTASHLHARARRP